MKVGSLFSGIGGLDLGLERAGMKVVYQVEKDPYCQKVLKKHWPEVPCYGDIKEIDFTTLPPVDLICGGFPCQPVSCAGKRQGDKDERWLWPEFYRAVCEAGPRWVLVENVPGLLSISDGRLFGGILGDLARIGYDAEWDLLPAAAFGAPHLRYRCFLVAYSIGSVGRGRAAFRGTDYQRGRTIKAGRESLQSENGETRPDNTKPGSANVADAPGPRCGSGQPGESREIRHETRGPQSERRNNDGHTPGQRLSHRVFSQVARCQEGNTVMQPERSDWWATEPDVGRVAHGVPNRVDRLKSLGNAVVPQVVEWIGRRIGDAVRDA